MVQLSPAEKSYLYDSLTQQPIIRPDLRSIHQYRPLVAKTSFYQDLMDQLVLELKMVVNVLLVSNQK